MKYFILFSILASLTSCNLPMFQSEDIKNDGIELKVSKDSMMKQKDLSFSVDVKNASTN